MVFRLACALLMIILSFQFGGCRSTGPLSPESQSASNVAVWGMRSGDAQRQGQSPLAGPGNADTLWTFAADGNFNAAPVLSADGSIYAVASRILLAFDRNGNFKWRYQADADIQSAPGVSSDGTIRVATRYGQIHAVNPDGTCQAVYSSHLTFIRDAVFADDGTAYLHSIGLSGLASQTVLQATGAAGEDLWQVEIDEPFGPGVELSAGQLYFATLSTRVTVYNTAGEFVWKLARPDMDYYSRALAPNGMVYMYAEVPDSEDHYQVTAYNSTGETLWSRAVSYNYSQVDKTPQTGPDGRLYISNNEDVMHVFSAAGEELWTKDDVSTILGVSPTGFVYTLDGNWQHYAMAAYDAEGFWRWGSDTYHDFRGNLIFTGDDTLLFTGYAQGAFDGGLADTVPYGLHELLPTGEILWSYRPGGSSIADLVVDTEGTAYVSTLGALFALDSDGRVLWRTATTGDSDSEYASSGLVFGPGGCLYCIGRDNQLHCYNTDGSLIRKTNIGATSRVASMAADRNLVYLPIDATLLALDGSGNTVYQFAADQRLQGGPAIGEDGTAYLVDIANTCYAVSSTGAELWRFESDYNSEWLYPVVAGADRVLFPVLYGVAAVDAMGQEQWRFVNDEELLYCEMPVVADDGSIYLLAIPTADSPSDVTDDVTWLFALDPDGQVQWRLEFDVKCFRQPVVDSTGMIYLYSIDHLLVAVSPDGEEQWRDISVDHSVDYPNSVYILIAPGERFVVHDGWGLRVLGS